MKAIPEFKDCDIRVERSHQAHCSAHNITWPYRRGHPLCPIGESELRFIELAIALSETSAPHRKRRR
jgi:hypothetical protein